MACSYKTITLTPGEQFILPSGAEIITVSDTTALEVTNGCTALDKLEDYKCYISYFFETVDDGSQQDICGDTYVYGVHLNGVDYGFSTSRRLGKNRCNPCSSLQTFLQDELNRIVPGLFKDFHIVCEYDTGRGSVCAVNFKTLDSIAGSKNAYFLISCGNCVGDGCPGLTIQFRIQPLSDGIPGIHGTGDGC